MRLRRKAVAIVMLFVVVVLALSTLTAAGKEFPRPAAQVGQEICYAIADEGGDPPGDDLLTIVSLTGGVETVVGSPHSGSIEALTFQPATGLLFGADSRRLGTFNLTTGQFNPFSNQMGFADGAEGSIEIRDVDGLAFDPTDGTLYAAVRREINPGTIPDLLVKLNPVTGRVVEDGFGPDTDYLVVPTFMGNIDITDIDDIAIDPEDGTMYAIANTRGRGDHLVTIDKQTAEVTDIAELGVFDMEGLTFDTTARLLGTTGKDGGAHSNQLWRIDKDTGIADMASTAVLTAGSDYEGVTCLLSWDVVTVTPTPTSTNTPTATPTVTPSPTPTLTPTAPTAVELLYFRAEQSGGQSVRLSWATLREINTDSFILYRAADGDFSQAEEIYSVNARGGGSTYEFTDTPPAGQTWVYWLYELERDGSLIELASTQLQISVAPEQKYKLFAPLMISP